jgi:tetratricopeptide (TPR) repeat protein
MKKNTFHIALSLFAILGISQMVFGIQQTSPSKLRALYNSLDPNSLAQHLAFYDLYAQSVEGQQAVQHAYLLLTGSKANTANSIFLPSSLASSIHNIVGLVNKNPNTPTLELDDAELEVINNLAGRLHNRKLAGFHAPSEEFILTLPPHHIDLGRAILLTQLGNGPDAIRKIKSYEATIDLMALQVLAKTSFDALPSQKIRAINHFIFDEMGFRFPPHSLYAKDVDLYTFLPSVLDSRRGVCLGVSILYICLAQRLNLDLHMVTPPGHIFVSWRQDNRVINIETTARGIHLPDEKYLGVDTRSLQQRNVKEVIGLAHFNQASVYWERNQHEEALKSYIKALPYLPEDKLLIKLMAINTLLKGDIDRGKELLRQILNYTPEDAISKDTIAEDFLNGNVDIDGIKAIFMHVDEKRESILAKRKDLESCIDKYPKCREAYFNLGISWLQLHRTSEALESLRRYHALDPSNANVEYYLAVLYAERLDYNNAWKHFRIAEALTKLRDHHPEALIELRKALARQCPE